jgi:hypothetical protein
VPYSESLRKAVDSGPVLVKIRCIWTCFRPVQGFDLLGWGSSPFNAFTHETLGKPRKGFRGNRPEQKMQTNYYHERKNPKGKPGVGTINALKQVHTHARTHTRANAHARARTHMHAHAHGHAHAHAHGHVHVNAHAHEHAHAHVHTHTDTRHSIGNFSKMYKGCT